MSEHPSNLNLQLNEKNEKIYREWNKFMSGENDVDTDIVNPDILASWKRCRALGIDPLSSLQNPVLSGHDFLIRFEQNRRLIEAAQPVLNKLFETARSSFTVALFDADGFLLQVLKDEKYTMSNVAYKWYPGVRWTEAHSGSNTIASCLAHKKPVRYTGAQHFKKVLHYISAASTPILDPDGELLGGISLSTFLYITHPHTFGMSIAAAHAIENDLRMQKAISQRNEAFNETDIILSLQRAVITYVPDAMIAVSNAGRVYGMNEQAKKMFGPMDDDVIGQRLCDICTGEENRFFLDVIDLAESVKDTEIRLHTAQGAADCTLTCNNVHSPQGAVIGKIIIVSEIKRIKSLVNKMIGAKANFHFDDIYTRDHHFKKIIEQARAISDSTSNVLLLGESGTGKDIFAQAIHNGSPRKDGPYIAINCAAIPRDLIASELFGHEEGAFTGARRGGSQGKFELADGGTIFLDEIAETPLEFQAALLRVLEDKCIIRIGSNRVYTVDVRIISATNRDLPSEVKKGNFRKDLFYRLNVFNIHLPPLRERPDDISLLMECFTSKYSITLGKTIRGAADDVTASLRSYAWPGNVRELQNIIERMVNYATSDTLTADLIPQEIIGRHRIHGREMDLESPEETEKRMIRHLLTLKFRKTQIAEHLNISRTTLFRKMAKYGLGHKNTA